ncbi:hypothetical protein DID75_01905 [Candidatus Marinamargulisbacteria bacterium SCGC AG-410-N11]|nr:hypothetical protein DID75_01905 [Candidatus Marinamargulisbacteria bacterium SCGC AG-410-N11]
MRLFYFSIIVLLYLFTSLLFGDSVKLTADKIYFEESSREVIATSNVSIQYKDLSIESPNLHLNVDDQIIWGSGDILFKRGTEAFTVSYFKFDLNNEIGNIEDITLKINPYENKSNTIYLKALSLEDKKDLKTGIWGLATTCELDHPHNYIKAYKFKYFPDKRINLYGAWLYNEFTFFPFNFLPPIPLLEIFPLPFYSYKLGKRKRVWNFPTIGKKNNERGWGWFVQNTIDYAHIGKNKDSSIFVDWFEAKKHEGRKGSLGLGIRHFYEFNNFDGKLYYYFYNFEQDYAPLKNQMFSLSNRYQWKDIITIKTSFKEKNIDHSLHSRVKNYSQFLNGDFTYNDLGNKYNFNIKESHNFTGNNHSLRTGFIRSYNGSQIFSMNYNKNEAFLSKRKTIDANLKHNFNYPSFSSNLSTFKFSSNLDYKELNYQNTYPAPNTSLKGSHSISTTLFNKINLNILTSYMKDLDNDRVTSDIKENSFLYKLPEINMDFSVKDKDLNKFFKRFKPGYVNKTKFINKFNKIFEKTTTFNFQQYYDSLNNLTNQVSLINEKSTTNNVLNQRLIGTANQIVDPPNFSNISQNKRAKKKNKRKKNISPGEELWNLIGKKRWIKKFDTNWAEVTVKDSQLKKGLSSKKFKKYERSVIRFLKKYQEPKISGLSFNTKLTIARYREYAYDINKIDPLDPNPKIEPFPNDVDFSIVPNTYILKQSMSKSFTKIPIFNLREKKMPFKTKFTISPKFTQWVFQTPGYKLGEGDQQNELSLSMSQSSKIELPKFVFFVTGNAKQKNKRKKKKLKYTKHYLTIKSSYSSSYTPIENGTPFKRFLNKRTIAGSNKLTEKINYQFQKSKLKYFPFYFNVKWNNSTSYDFKKEKEKWGVWQTSLQYDITKRFNMMIKTGKYLNFGESVLVNNRFRDTSFRTKLKFIENKKAKLNLSNKILKFMLIDEVNFNHYLNLDTNVWKDEKISKVNNSNFSFSIKFGLKKLYKWRFNINYNYEKPPELLGKPQGFDVKYYEQNSYSIIKEEHHRKIEFTYSRKAEVLTFKYTFNAFPNEPLDLIKTKDKWELQGKFKGSIESRYD